MADAKFSAGALAKARTQIEFYFSDSNLPRDKFLKEKANEDEDKPGEGQGYVELAVLCSFARMRKLAEGGDAADFVKAVAEALAESATLDVSEDGAKVRRNSPMPGAHDATPTSIHADNLPLDSTLEGLQEFFATFGKVVCVRMRHTQKKGSEEQEKKFKGGAFVEFETEEEAAKAMAAEKPELGGNVLTFQTKKAFAEEAEKKHEEWLAKKAAGKGKASPKPDRAGKEEAPAEEVPAYVAPTTFPAKACLKLADVADGVRREDMKEKIAACGEFKIDFINFRRGDTEGYVLFADEGAAAAVAEKELELGGATPALSVAEGDIEKAQWEEVWRSKAAIAKKKAEGGFSGNRGGKRRQSGGGGGGKRHRS